MSSSVQVTERVETGTKILDTYTHTYLHTHTSIGRQEEMETVGTIYSGG